MRMAGAVCLLVVAGFAQEPSQDARAAQQEAYQQWRKTDPNLERDANSAGAILGARADKVAAAAVKYFNLRKNYLEGRAADARRSAALVEPVNVAPDAITNLDRFVTVQDTNLRSNIATIAANPDRAIQQLRLALERERAALTAVAGALKDSEKSQHAAAQAGRDAEETRAKTAEECQKLAASLEESEQLTEKSSDAWAGYYRALSDAARGAADPVTSSGPPLPSTGREPAASSSVSTPAGAVHSVTPVPLVRYVGQWTYPTVGAHYHGAQPTTVDLVVREENGQASGRLTARFRLAPGAADNPVVHFEFAGAFANSRSQKFAVTTSSGAMGTLELIPGPAFNLLEVNFRTSDAPGTIREGNFLLVKQ